MAHWHGKRKIIVVSACMTKDGTPTFAMNSVEVTHDEAANGIHYYLAEADLLGAGFEEPFVHFDETESPRFLIPGVTDYLKTESTELPITGSPINQPELADVYPF